jgi:hypothetical protein
LLIPFKGGFKLVFIIKVNSSTDPLSNAHICVALSTAEAEYVALASAAQEVIWMRQLKTDLKNDLEGTTVI